MMNCLFCWRTKMMKNKIASELFETTFLIFEQSSNKLLGSGSVFMVGSKNDSYRVFAIFPFESIENSDNCYLQFDAVNNGKDTNHRFNFTKEFALRHKNNLGIVIVDFANSLNFLRLKNINLKFKGILNENIRNEELDKNISDFENITLIHPCSDLEGNKIFLKTSNLTGLFEDSYFYVNSFGVPLLGSAAFLYNQGGFFTENTIYSGSRLIYLGMVVSLINNSIFKVLRAEEIFNIISKIK